MITYIIFLSFVYHRIILSTQSAGACPGLWPNLEEASSGWWAAVDEEVSCLLFNSKYIMPVRKKYNQARSKIRTRMNIIWPILGCIHSISSIALYDIVCLIGWKTEGWYRSRKVRCCCGKLAAFGDEWIRWSDAGRCECGSRSTGSNSQRISGWRQYVDCTYG